MSANMGGSPAAAFDPAILAAVAGDTQYGRVWVARILLAVVVMAIRVRPGPVRDKRLLILSGLLLVSVALTGHSALPGGVPGLLHQFADVLHLLAAGWWIGGLLALVLVSRSLGHRATAVLERFSGLGYGAVAAIVGTGLFKSVILVATINSSVSTAYGWTLLVKLALFAAMGLLALSNHFWITPALKRGGEPAVWLPRLHKQVLAEFALGLAVLAVVGVLGALQPPISN
jgi:putative copper resistance protein D